jgi:hypothetical protein
LYIVAAAKSRIIMARLIQSYKKSSKVSKTSSKPSKRSIKTRVKSFYKKYKKPIIGTGLVAGAYGAYRLGRATKSSKNKESLMQKYVKYLTYPFTKTWSLTKRAYRQLPFGKSTSQKKVLSTK